MTLQLSTFAPLLVGGGAGLVAFIALSVAEFIGDRRDRARRRNAMRVEQYRAEQSIRSIRREAIREMLEAECDQRYAYDPNVIEGTAVEVRR
jgi:hypothetical protein